MNSAADLSPDILIIGGGVIGLMCARELAKAGAQVTLLDRQVIGKESSWAGGGILSPLYPWRAPSAITALSRWSQRAYPELIAELMEATGVDPEWLPCGLLVSDCGEIKDATEWCQVFAVNHERLDRDSFHRLEPRLGDFDVSNPLHLPDIAQVRNPRLLAALRRDLTQRGVRLLEHQEVVDLESISGRVTAVLTREARFTAANYLVASGAWSPLIGGDLTQALEVEPVKGQMLVFAAVPGLIRHIILHEGRYLIPRKDGRLLVGSTVEHTGFDKATSEEARASLIDFALSVLPALGSYPVEKHWAGLRPGSLDGIPVIGAHPEIPNLFFNCGQFRNGFALAPASSRLLADLILKREPCVVAEPYNAHNRAGQNCANNESAF